MIRSTLVPILALLLIGCEAKTAPTGAATSATPAATTKVAATTTSTASPAAAQAEPLKVGDAAPDVTFKLHDGKDVSLASLRGKDVLVYFYPKDDTPGCTVEAKGIKESWADFEKAGIEVYGVSTQDADSHVAFKDKYGLPFPLVVDTDGKVASAFRVPVQNGFARRQSFLVGKDGKIKKVWLDVDPNVHASSVLGEG